MPNNVYIGSRYVPIFDGIWNNTKSYEALTIVEYGNNTYTSKKPVPVGTLPTNTSYWALTGNYNGQISNLQSQVDTINLELRSAHIFESAADMIASDIDFEDDAIIIISDGTIFKVVTSSNPITRALNNGKYAELLPDDKNFYHIGSLGLSSYADIYPILNYLFSNGNSYIYIENGNYSMSDTLVINYPVTPQIQIIGESKTNTKIKCAKGFLNVLVYGYTFRGSIIENLRIEGTTEDPVGGDYNGIELTWASLDANNMIDYINLNDLLMSYFNNAISLGGRVIWNKFTNLTLLYNKIAFSYSSRTNSSYFNNNVFINCEFDTNLNYGLYFNCEPKHGLSNIFIGCSCEGNNYGDTTSSNLAEMVLINFSAKFDACHFEKTSGVTNFVVVVPVKCCLLFNGCAFFNYAAHMLTNSNSMAVFEGSSEVNCSETVYGTDTGTTVFEHTFTMV